MKIAFFSTHKFERPFYENLNQSYGFSFTFFESALNKKTVELAREFDVICAFANDNLSLEVMESLKSFGIKLIALRSAGFNHVDMTAAHDLKIPVVRVPEYSPYSVAEHAVALILCLNRKIHRAYNRVREGNFSLDGLTGFDLHGKTVGVVGTGKIGAAFCQIMTGFGCRVLAFDKFPSQALKDKGVEFVALSQLIAESDIISLHVPLNKETFHLIGKAEIDQMKSGVMLVNTSRGALLDTKALIEGLKSGQIKSAALDVYEEEEGLFFHDFSETIIQDDLISRLISFPNVLVTSHQAFLTKEALTNISETTLENIAQFMRGEKLSHEVRID